MENAADALKMAAAVLIFVLALSITISAFSEARQASDIILQYNDREYEYTYVEENKDDAGNVLTERIVGIESIIPSIYKAYKENYKIVFPYTLYEKRNSQINGANLEINYIDLQKESLPGGETQKRMFIDVILYGKKYFDLPNKYNKSWDEILKDFEISGIFFVNYTEGLHSKIQNKKFKESLGVYYQEEVDGDTPEADSSTPNANKTKKRVITYSTI